MAKKQPGLTLAALQSKLRKEAPAPVTLVAGAERFLADEAVRSITAALRPGGAEISRRFYRGDEADLAEVLDGLRTLDLFSPTRLAVVSPADPFVEKHWDALAAYASAPPPGTYLVLVVEKANGSRKLTKLVREADGLVACNRVYERDILPWIAARTKAMGRQIESRAAALLAEFLGTDLAALAAELDKLAAYLGERKKITAADVEAASLRDRSREIYELTEAVGRRQPAQVLTTLHGLLERGGKPAGILFMVSRHIRRIWTVKELTAQGIAPVAAARQVGVQYFIERFLAQVDTFTLGDLRRNCSALTRCEAALKRSGADDRILLETTFLALLRRRPRRAARST